MATVSETARRWLPERDGYVVGHLGIFSLLFAVPLLFSMSLGSRILIFAVFAMGYNLLLGYTGELSFGHAAYFGVGAYGTAAALQHVTSSLYVGILVGVLLATVVSVVFGYVSFQQRAIYFAMITIGLAMMVYIFVLQFTGITGGSNGLPVPLDVNSSLGVIDPYAGGWDFFLFAFVVVIAVSLFLWRVVNSPFGRVLVAIRENDMRTSHLGYDVFWYLLLAFVISGAISGIAGALYATLFAFVSPSLLFWLISGEVILVTILGGVGSRRGPIVGALVFILLQDLLVDLTASWRFAFGAIIIFIVLFAPLGLWGLYESMRYGDASTLSVESLLENLRVR